MIREQPSGVRVSYLITTLNRADFLERTLANVRDFIGPEDEVVIIDGGSTDRTMEVVEANADIVATFVSEADCGEAHAFNKGLRRVRGRLVKPITDDDYFYPEAMRRLVAAMEENPCIDAIQGGGEIWNAEEGQPVFRCFRFLPEDVPADGRSIFDFACSGLGLIVRTSVIDRVGGVGGDYVSIDNDLCCRLVECDCRLRYYDINLYRWYLRPYSNYRRSLEVDRDQMMFDIRLSRWDRVMGRWLETLIFQIGRGGGCARSLARGMWVLGYVFRSPLRALIAPAWWVMRAAVGLRRSIARPGRKVSRGQEGASPAPALGQRQWSGALR